jgi:hypothetical protein
MSHLFWFNYQKTGEQMIEIANIFIWKKKAYFPVLGKTNVGFFWDTDQLLVTDLSLEQIGAALEEIIKIGNPPIPHPIQEEFQKKTPLKKALKMTSYKKMAREGVIWIVISWEKDYIGVAFLRLMQRIFKKLITKIKKSLP